jgi:branched-chain amino acid transport system substrate-binding protein
MRGTTLWSLVLPVLCIAGLFGLSGHAIGAGAPEEIEVGVVFPLTGPVSSIGIAKQRGLSMAIDEINAAGGIKALGGAKIKLIFGDDEAKPANAMAEGERLIKQEKVTVLIGSYTSSCSFPLTQVAEANKIPIIVGSSAKKEITERGFKYTFRTELKAPWIGRDEINFMNWLGKETGESIKTVALLFEDSGWGQSWSSSIRPLLKESGYKKIADLSYPKDTKDARSYILKLKAAKPDLTILESYTEDAILLQKTMHELQFECKGVLATGTGHSSPFFHEGVGGLDNYLILWESWSPELPLPGLKAMAKKFLDQFGTPIDPFSAKAYTVGYILAGALERAGSVEKDKIRDALRQTKMNPGENGNTHPYVIEYDEDGQAVNAVGVVSQWLNGKKEVLWPPEFATKKPVFPIPPWSER